MADYRGLCVKCGARIPSAKKFGVHLITCTEPPKLALIFQLLDVQVRTADECWIARDFRNTPRAVPKVATGYKRSVKACHVIATITHGERPDGMMLRHWCDNRRCMNPAHLLWGTAGQNIADAWRNGRRVWTQEHQDALLAGWRASSNKGAVRG